MNRTILVVDDDESILNVISTILTAKGYEVLTAKDTSGFLDLFKAHQDRIDLVLIDIRIGGESGFELADILEQEFGFHHQMFITAFFWEEETLNELLKRGKLFFEKPLNFQKVVLPSLMDYFGDDKP